MDGWKAVLRPMCKVLITKNENDVIHLPLYQRVGTGVVVKTMKDYGQKKRSFGGLRHDIELLETLLTFFYNGIEVSIRRVKIFSYLFQ